jgi:hypothetical protein
VRHVGHVDPAARLGVQLDDERHRPSGVAERIGSGTASSSCGRCPGPGVVPAAPGALGCQRPVRQLRRRRDNCAIAVRSRPGRTPIRTAYLRQYTTRTESCPVGAADGSGSSRHAFPPVHPPATKARWWSGTWGEADVVSIIDTPAVGALPSPTGHLVVTHYMQAPAAPSRSGNVDVWDPATGR